MEQDDFGYSKVEWEAANPENVRLVEEEYRQRLQGTLTGAEDIDKKAQYVLSGLIALITAILGLAFSKSIELQIHSLVGLFTLAAMFGLAAIFASLSVYPRPYAHFGTTPSNLDVSKWKQLLMGDEKESIRLAGIRIKEYARAIKDHKETNDQKSTWLKRALRTTVAAFPVAALFSLATYAAVVFLNSPHIAVVSPIDRAICTAHATVRTPIIILIVVAALLAGVVIGALIGRFSASHWTSPT